VKRLVEMHGGKVEAKSDGMGKGTEFVVTLPGVSNTSEPDTALGSQTVASKSSLRILIVDDNQDSANTLAMMQNILGNETRTAYDGQEGVEQADRYLPDVALFDIRLPKLNDYEACRRIREQPWGKAIVMIAVTGWGQKNDRAEQRGTKISPLQFSMDLRGLSSFDGSHHASAFDPARVAHSPGASSPSHLFQS